MNKMRFFLKKCLNERILCVFYYSKEKDQGIRLVSLQNIPRTCLLPPAPSLAQAIQLISSFMTAATHHLSIPPVYFQQAAKEFHRE